MPRASVQSPAVGATARRTPTCPSGRAAGRTPGRVRSSSNFDAGHVGRAEEQFRTLARNSSTSGTAPMTTNSTPMMRNVIPPGCADEMRNACPSPTKRTGQAQETSGVPNPRAKNDAESDRGQPAEDREGHGDGHGIRALGLDHVRAADAQYPPRPITIDAAQVEQREAEREQQPRAAEPEHAPERRLEARAAVEPASTALMRRPPTGRAWRPSQTPSGDRADPDDEAERPVAGVAATVSPGRLVPNA